MCSAHYLPEKRGSRLAAKAARPSLASSERITSTTKRCSILRASSSSIQPLLITEALALRTASGPLAAIRSAICRAFFNDWPVGTAGRHDMAH